MTKEKTVLVPETVKVKKTVMEKKKVKQKKRSRTPMGTGSPLERVAGKKDSKGGTVFRFCSLNTMLCYAMLC